MMSTGIMPAPIGRAMALGSKNSETRSIPKGAAKRQPNSQRFHAFKIVQYLHHPETGEVLMTPAQLQIGLAHRSFTKWGWIEHNQDHNSDGSLVPPHVHIALQCKDARSLEQIAKWFGVPMDLVKPLGGRGAFISYVRYLTHEDPNQQALGKHRYPDANVVANFDWRSEVNEHFARSLKLPSRLDDIILGVLKGDFALWEVRESEPLPYAKNLPFLKRLAEDCRMADIEAGRASPAIKDMKLRVATGVTLTDALTWIADRLNFEGDEYDRMLWASSVVMGKENPVGVAD